MNTQINAFVNELTVKDTTTWNGALSNSSTGDEFLNQFAKAGTYRGRPQVEVDNDMAHLWAIDPELALKLAFYLRIVTRKNKGIYKTETVQKGQGVRDEVFKRMLWVAKYHPKTFTQNLLMFAEVGSWKDVIQLWRMDSVNVSLNDIFNLFKGIFELELENGQSFHTANIKKFIPTLRSKSDQTSEGLRKNGTFVKAFQKFFNFSDKQYRAFKKSGDSHAFQRIICAKSFDLLEFQKIAGKALFNLVNKKNKRTDGKSFLERHKLENIYETWLDSQPIAKFTGYPYELYNIVAGDGHYKTTSRVVEKTVNKQFETLIQLAKVDNGGLKGNVWCALDTSGSMHFKPFGDTSVKDIAISLAIYFSALNEGTFKDNVIMFNNKSTNLKLSGTFTDKVKQIPNDSMGGTNFQSVIDEIVRVRKQNPNIPVSDFPETIVVVSDLQFNPVSLIGNYQDVWRGSVLPTQQQVQTNYEAAMEKLEAVGLPRVTMVWWNLNSQTKDYPSRVSDKGTIQISGFDGAVLSLLLGGEAIIDKETGEKRKPTPLESMMTALNQELLMYVKI